MRKILLLLIIFVFFSTSVYAGCCMAVTNEGPFCVSEVEEKDCLDFSPIECSEIAACSTKGCCSDVEGRCMKGVSSNACTLLGGIFGEGDENCEVDQCQPKCCYLAGNYFMAYPDECTSEVYGVGEITELTAEECVSQDAVSVKGCCRTETSLGYECTMTDAESCQVEFFLGQKCSGGSVMQCNCESKASLKECVGASQEGNVCWYDSCGNEEGVVSINDPRESFEKLNVEPFDGECHDAGEILNVTADGNIICMVANCKNTWDNPFTDEDFDGVVLGDRVDRLNGESWCEYQQARVGYGFDFVGTSHYKHSCVNGKEVVQICGNENGMRDKYCVETRTRDSMGVLMSTAQCLPQGQETNLAEDCATRAEGLVEGEQEACESPGNCKWIPFANVGGGYFFYYRYDHDTVYQCVDLEKDNREAEFWVTVTLVDEFIEEVGPRAYNGVRLPIFAQVVHQENYLSPEKSLWVDSRYEGDNHEVPSMCDTHLYLIIPTESFLDKDKPYRIDVYRGGTHDYTFGDFIPNEYTRAQKGKCIPLVASNDKEICSQEFMQFASHNLLKLGDNFWDLPTINKSRYVTYDPSSIKSEISEDFIMEGMSKLANAYGACGYQNNYIGYVGSGLELEGYVSLSNVDNIATLISLYNQDYLDALKIAHRPEGSVNEN